MIINFSLGDIKLNIPVRFFFPVLDHHAWKRSKFNMQWLLVLVSAAVMSAMITAASGHLCMLSPPQRGSMLNINKPASPDCGLVTGPCGERKAGDSVVGVKAGSKFLVAFQKNLDHFNENNPGFFNVTVSFDGEVNFLPLLIIPDTSDPSLSLYYKNVTMPTGPVSKSGTLRVDYVTNNPKAPPNFFQCSDIILYM